MSSDSFHLPLPLQHTHRTSTTSPITIALCLRPTHCKHLISSSSYHCSPNPYLPSFYNPSMSLPLPHPHLPTTPLPPLINTTNHRYPNPTIVHRMLFESSSQLQIFSTFSLWQPIQDNPLLATPSPPMLVWAVHIHDRMPTLCQGPRRGVRRRSNMLTTQQATRHRTVDWVLQGLCSTQSFQTAVRGNCHRCQPHHSY